MTRPSNSDTNGASPEPAIEMRDVWKAFGDVRVHRGVSLKVKPGEIMTLVGGSGQGKSVLLKEIIGLMKPDKGEILVGGQDVVKMNETALMAVRRNVGMLFQGAALFDSLDVLENVAFPLREHLRMPESEILRIVREKLELVDMDGTEEKMPAELSGGMKKRVGLARAIAIEPSIILYDEPTTGLDPTNAHRIDELILRLQKRLDVTSVIVTHDMEHVQAVTDRLAMLYRGRIIAVGTWEEMEQSDVPVVRQFIEGTVEEW